MKITETCLRREGGDRCHEEIAWAKCIAIDGLGYCEGIMAYGEGRAMRRPLKE